MQEIRILKLKDKAKDKKNFKIEMYWEHRKHHIVSSLVLSYYIYIYEVSKIVLRKTRMRVMFLTLVLYGLLTQHQPSPNQR